MDIKNRKRCPACRFMKCTAVGMQTTAVRQDRKRGGRNYLGSYYKEERARRSQNVIDHLNSSCPPEEAIPNKYPTGLEPSPPGYMNVNQVYPYPHLGMGYYSYPNESNPDYNYNYNYSSNQEQKFPTPFYSTPNNNYNPQFSFFY